MPEQEFDPALKRAMAEIKAVIAKYDVGAAENIKSATSNCMPCSMSYGQIIFVIISKSEAKSRGWGMK